VTSAPRPDPHLALLALEAAEAWISGDPQAVQRADDLARYATDTRRTPELVRCLLDCLGAALSTRPSIASARTRLAKAAAQAAETLITADERTTHR